MAKAVLFASAAPRILVVRVGAMGDVLHALPAVAALRTRLPRATVGWAIEPHWAPLLQAAADAKPGSAAMPLVDGVHAVRTREWSRGPASRATLADVLALRRELRAARYDLALDLQGSIRSSIIARMSGAPAVLGPAAPRERLARLFYRSRVPLRSTHVIDQALEMAEAALGHMGFTAETAARAETLEELAAQQPLLPVDPEADAWAAQMRPQPDRNTVLLAPTAGWGAKQWPVHCFAALAAAFAARGHGVVVNAQANASDSVADAVVQGARALLSADKADRVRAVPATLPQLIALVRCVGLVVAGDTGPLHLAAALGIPVVALFGPTDPARTGPYSSNSVALRDPKSVTDHRRHTDTEPGLACIHVDTVLEAGLRLLGAAAQTRRGRPR